MEEKKLKLASKAFREGEKIPVRYTGRGEDISPELTLENIHAAAKSIAIMMDDLDIAIIGRYNHWIIWNVPICNIIPESISFGKQITEPFPAIQGIAYGKHRYRGPKPPRIIKRSHRYVFTAYVLDCMCDLPPYTKKRQWLKAMESHILQQASLSGTFCNTY
jgi:Raf kinase inhibitor-like YbhB/YbcL family protein